MDQDDISLLTSITESSPDGFWLIDADGNFLDVNQRACDMLGYSQSQLLKMNVLDVESTENTKEFAAHIQRITEKGSDCFETVHRRSDGTPLDVEIIAQYIAPQTRPKTGRFVVFVRDVTAKKLAQQQLQKSEEKYRTLVEVSQDLVFQCDMEGRYTFLSEQWEQVFGYSRNEMLGRPFTDFQSPETAARDIREFSRLLDMSSVRGYTTVHKAKDGRDVHLSFNARYVQDADGNVTGTAGTAHDITKLEEALNAIREEQRFTETVLNALEDTLFLFEPATGKALRWNESFSKISGYSNEEIARLPAPQSYYSERDLEKAAALMEDVNRHGSGTVEIELICKNGRRVPTEYRVSSIKDDEGKNRFMISLGRDLTHLRRMEQDYLTLFNEMLNGFALHEIICDDAQNPVDYRFLAINPAFEKMTGITQDVIGKSIKEIMPSIEQSWIDTYGKVALTGEPVLFENFNAALGKHFEVTAFRPAPMQFACIFDDITARRELEERLRHSEKMEAIGHLAGGIAHDFNNMLGGIIGYAELSLDGLSPGDPLHNNLNQILAASERARNLVQQILSFSRRNAMEKTAVYVTPIVQEVILLIRATLPASMEITSEISAETLPVLADATRIHEIVMNLCTNAARAMTNEQGVMKIVCGDWTMDSVADGILGRIEPGLYSRILVADNGCGMDKTTRDRAFEPFFTTRATGEGTGMGLATVFGIVESHSGNIRVESAPGKGTIFEIFLPKTTVTPDCTPPDTQRIDGGSEHILVVDDEPILCDILKALLVSLGYTVTTANGSVAALETFSKDPQTYDVVLTDQTMPEMSGLDLAQKLIALRPDLPVVLATGYSRQVNDDVVRASGLVGCLMKPIRKKALAEMIRNALQKSFSV